MHIKGKLMIVQHDFGRQASSVWLQFDCPSNQDDPYVQAHAFATITMYSWWQFGELACRSEIIFFQGGVEAGRAYHCR